MQSPYPSRYRVIERGRRLITIDTQTGQEVGGLGTMPPPPPPQAVMEAPEPSPVEVEAPIARPPLSESRSALAPARPQVSVKLKPGGMLPLAVFVGVIVVIFLISTYLWVPLLLAMFVPQVRAAAFDKAKAAIRKIKDDQAATG